MIKFVRKNYVPLLVTLVVCMGTPIWPFWSISEYIWTLGSLLLIYTFYTQGRFRTGFSGGLLIGILALIVFAVFIPFLKGGLHISYILYVALFLVAFKLKPDESARAVNYITTRLAIIVGISLPLWFIQSYIYPILPVYNELDIGVMKSGVTGQTVMSNYIFFVQHSDFIDSAFRFYSMFDEPGVLGTLGAFVLFANKFDFKDKRNIVILVGCIFTFSFAFYVLAVMGYGYTLVISKNKSKIKIMLLAIIVLIPTFFFVRGLEAFDMLITYRFNSGLTTSLDNRSKDALSNAWENNKWKTMYFWLGDRVEAERYNDNGSYKAFILHNGFLTLLSLILLYYNIVPRRRRNRDIFYFFIIFWLSFLQRPQVMSSLNILLYSSIAGCLYYDNKRDSEIRNQTKKKLYQCDYKT